MTSVEKLLAWQAGTIAHVGATLENLKRQALEVDERVARDFGRVVWTGESRTAADARLGSSRREAQDKAEKYGWAAGEVTRAAEVIQRLQDDLRGTISFAASQHMVVRSNGDVDDAPDVGIGLDVLVRPGERWVLSTRIKGICRDADVVDERLSAVLNAIPIGSVPASIPMLPMTPDLGGLSDWLNDRAQEGMDWASDAVDWVAQGATAAFDTVSEFIGDRLEALGPALNRIAQADATFLSQFTRIFTEGRRPQASELGASVALMGGTAFGAVANLVTGRDDGWFEQGKPYAGYPKVDLSPKDPSIHGYSDLTKATMDAYDHSAIRIQSVTDAAGTTRYIVSIPGTEGEIGSPSGWQHNYGANNWAANLGGIAQGTNSTGAEAVKMALENARIPPGAEILFTGHSQGGTIAANVAADPAIAARYNIKGIIGFGSPMDCADIPKSGPGSVPILSIQHANDVVPKTDLGGQYFGGIVPVPVPLPSGPLVIPVPILLPDAHPNISHVTLPPVLTGDPFKDITEAHIQAGYEKDMSGSLSDENKQVWDEFAKKNGLGNFLAPPGSKSTVTRVEIGGWP